MVEVDVGVRVVSAAWGVVVLGCSVVNGVSLLVLVDRALVGVTDATPDGS